MNPPDTLHALREAARQAPNDPSILSRLASEYHCAGQMIPALQTYDRLIELGAATAEIWCSTGNALAEIGEYAQAIGAYEHSLQSGDAQRNSRMTSEASHNLARALYKLGDGDRAAEQMHRLIRQHDLLDTWIGLATILPGCPHASHAEVLKVRQTLGRKLSELGPPRSRLPLCRGRRRLRIGYLSAHFASANYMKPVWSMINHHDRDAVEVHLFADQASSHELEWFRAGAHDCIHETTVMDNEQLAAAIRDCDIDILVDLNAYSAAERLPLFRAPVAPLTVAWFNMYATSGLPAFDYLIGDDEVIRAEEEPFYTEKICRLPISYLTFDVHHAVPDVVEPPCLANGYVTFGSLVTQYKITPPVIDAWAEILNLASDARLVIANRELKSLQNRQYLQNRFLERHIDTDRITLLGPADHWTFLRYYDQIDVALDSFPYNGGTTTMEAIWQGVPVLTFDGDRWASRTSQTVLRRCHLAPFVAHDIDGYIKFARQLATDPQSVGRLAELRRTMRERLSRSQACDTKRMAREIETIYRRMGRQSGDGGPERKDLSKANP